MSKILRIVGLLVSALLWIWGAAKATLDWVGRATAMDDLIGADGIVAKALAWIFQTPWYVPAVLAALLTVVLCVLLLRRENLAGASKQNASDPPLVDDAEIRFHFYGDDRTPTKLHDKNIWRWYFLKNVMVAIDANDPSRRAKHVFGTMILTFDKPVKLGTVEVASPDSTLPTHEVKDFSNRVVVIAFFDEIPAGNVFVRVHI